MLRYIITHKIKFSIVVVILITSIVTAAVIYQGMNLASPTRRVLQDYHQEIINHPTTHGIVIHNHDYLEGKAPTLLVEPANLLSAGKRGEILRKQIASKGLPLTPHGSILKTVVLLHGRNGRKEDLLPVAERFCAVGLRCILIDLPAHGDSPVESVKFGADEWEQDLPRAVLLECAAKHGFSPDGAALWGMSMGGSFANSAIADSEHGHTWSSLVIICSFDNLAKVIENKSHSAFLVSCVAKICEASGGAKISEVSPSLWVKNVTTPVMVAHGTMDSLIPLENGKVLFDSYPSTDKRWVEVPNGTHSDILITPMPLYAEMAEWILNGE